MGKVEEALLCLEDQHKKLPKDTDFILFSAERLAYWGQIEQSKAVLRELEHNHVREGQRQRVLAQIASQELAYENSTQHWEQVLRYEPLATDAHESIAKLKAYTTGLETSVHHFRELTKQFPYHYSFLKDYVLWSQRLNRHAEYDALPTMLKSYPNDPWVNRELIFYFIGIRDFDSALKILELVDSLEPNSAVNDYLRGLIDYQQGSTGEARASWKRAIKKSVDHAVSMKMLVQSARNAEERVETFQLLSKELRKQYASAESVALYVQLATSYKTASELICYLQQFYSRHPEHWQVGISLLQLMSRENQWTEVETLANEMRIRYAFLPKVWFELGLIERSKPDFKSAAIHFSKAVEK